MQNLSPRMWGGILVVALLAVLVAPLNPWFWMFGGFPVEAIPSTMALVIGMVVGAAVALTRVGWLIAVGCLAAGGFLAAGIFVNLGLGVVAPLGFLIGAIALGLLRVK